MNELRYVYAVTRPFDGPLAEELRGVAATRPYVLHHDDLVAVVSAVPADDFNEIPLRAHLEELDWLTETAHAHQAVVAALTSLSCPLPLRLATVCRDDDGVRRLLDSDHDRFVRTLDRLDGRVEWGVKVYAETPEPSKRPPHLLPHLPPDRPAATTSAGAFRSAEPAKESGSVPTRCRGDCTRSCPVMRRWTGCTARSRHSSPGPPDTMSSTPPISFRGRRARHSSRAWTSCGRKSRAYVWS